MIVGLPISYTIIWLMFAVGFRKITRVLSSLLLMMIKLMKKGSRGRIIVESTTLSRANCNSSFDIRNVCCHRLPAIKMQRSLKAMSCIKWKSHLLEHEIDSSLSWSGHFGHEGHIMKVSVCILMAHAWITLEFHLIDY